VGESIPLFVELLEPACDYGIITENTKIEIKYKISRDPFDAKEVLCGELLDIFERTRHTMGTAFCAVLSITRRYLINITKLQHTE
jgi:hypothetical protein